MVQTRSNVPTTSHVVGEENAPGSGNGTGGIGSTPDAVQALFGLGVTAEQLQAAVPALSAMGGNVPGAGVGKAPLGLHAEHGATSQHKGKKTRRSRRRPGKAPAIEEVIVEDVPDEENDESSECRVSAFRRLGGEETRVSAFDRLDRGPEVRPGAWWPCSKQPFPAEFDDAHDSEAAATKRAPADSEEIAKKRKKKKDYTMGPRTPSAGVYSVGAPVGTGRELALSPLPHVEIYAVSSGAKYCEYHRNNTHNTKEFFTLQKEMHRLIARGSALRDDGAAPSRGPLEGRKWRKPTEPVAVAMQARNPEKRHIGQECDDLDEDEAQGYPVGFIHGGNIDTGSSVNIMYEKTFQDLGLDRKDLRPVRTPLSGFTGDSIEAEGVVTVPVIVGDGRPGLEDLECVISPYYLCMKFPTPSGIRVARGDQKLARSCYVRITKKLSRDETLVVHAQEEMRKLEARPKAEPAEEVEEVPLDPRAPERKVKVGVSLTGSQQKHLVDVLSAYRVIFAWGPGDMLGVDPKVICHRLAVNPKARPVKQKKRFLSSERREFVSNERLTPYFQAHPVQVLSQQPIGALLRNPNAPSRMSKWAVFLGAFQIEFKPRPAIKGQALADFMVECTAWEEPSPEEPEANDWWIVFTDGNSAAKNLGVECAPVEAELGHARAYQANGERGRVVRAEHPCLHCGNDLSLVQEIGWTIWSPSALPDDEKKAKLVRTRAPGYTLEGGNYTSEHDKFIEFSKREIGLSVSRAFSRQIAASETVVKQLDLSGELEGHQGCVNTISFNSTGDILVSGSDDKQVILWDWARNTSKLSYMSGHFDNIFQAKFMPFSDDRKIVTSSADGQAVLWLITQF
ncbi:unnamed protein product [Cuscuta campestris]|uniref:Uncharacterized protein n=1 Tax=Cuscuta campestris TaxID=132261 RepID=A0A484LJX6_9ASTE|nr:unnamed protein product [Cuscuta campestris]